ncbi:hypothetical protein LINPERPRIM_LOCUS6846 [Linum perenne]
MADSVLSPPSSAAAALSKSVKTTNLPSSPSSYYSPLLCKLFLFLLLLLAIPLLPSQAPDLFNQSFLTNLWELSQLLFIGLAVSYGLFSRRNVEPDDHFAADNGTVDESQSSFVSRIFQVSPLFEDSYDVVPSECEDKPAVQLSAASYGYTAPDAAVYDGYVNHQSVSVENCFEISNQSGGDEVIEAWNAQYFQGQSTVVASQPNLDVLGQCEMDNSQKPLGLPVRSLNSSARDSSMPDVSNNISEADDQSRGNGDAYGSGEELFGDVRPVNLEEKFNTTFEHSDFSRSVREETGVVPAVDRPGHFRPLSVDETQFESLKETESFFGSAKPPISSKDGVMQHKETTQYHTKSNSLPCEFDMDESGDDKTFHASNPPVTLSPPANMSGGSRMNAFHLRKYSSSGSLFKKESSGNSRGVLKEKDLGSSKDPLKGLGENKRDEDSEKKKKSQPSVKLDKKSGNEPLLAKSSSRGKSVRTVRSPGGFSTSEVNKAAVAMSHSYLEDLVGKAFDEIEAVDTSKKTHVAKLTKPSFAEYKKRDRQRSSSTRVNVDDRVGKTYDESEAVDGNKKNHGKATFLESKKRDSRKSSSRVSMEADEREESKNDESLAPSVLDSRVEAGEDHDLDEVDRKAAEFIAKFREQIMLQKVASIERSSRKRGVVKDSR